MKHSHDVYEMVKELTTLQGSKVADLAIAIGRQQSALQRSLQGNPTIKLLMECGWALGCDWHWIGMPLHRLEFFLAAGTIRFESDAPIHRVRSQKVRKQLHNRQFKAQPFDPADPLNREKMAEVYPPKALEGDNGKPLDCRFIEAPLPEYDGPTPSHAARRTQDVPPYTGTGVEHPVAATIREHAAAAQSHVHPDYAGLTPDEMAAKYMADQKVQARQATSAGNHTAAEPDMETEAGRNVMRLRLTDVATGGWVLSDRAMEAGHVPISQWQKVGWTIDKMKEHGYLTEARLLGLTAPHG